MAGSALRSIAYNLGPGRYYQAAYAHIAAELDRVEGTFLDVGCGPGWLGVHVARRAPQVQAMGVDLSPTALRQARQHGAGLPNLSFAQMDASALELEEGSVHAAASIQSAHHWVDTAGVLSELHRVLAPGAAVWIYEADPESPVPEGWISRRGPWPPDAWVRFNWGRFGMDAARWERLLADAAASPFGGGQDDRHGFYRRLVLTR